MQYFNHPDDEPECIYFSAFHRMLLKMHSITLTKKRADFGLQCFFAEEIRRVEHDFVAAIMDLYK